MKIKRTGVFLLIASMLLGTVAYGIDMEGYSNFDSYQLSNIVMESIPDDVFGGMYYTDDGTLVVNVTDTEKVKLNTNLGVRQSSLITVNEVKYTLAELEAMKDALVPYMLDYNIAMLDANEVTNSLDIGLYEDCSDVLQLIKEFEIIDVAIVNIAYIEDEIVFPIADELPETYAFGYIDSSIARATTTIYPGFLLSVQTSSGYGVCTAGPRLSSSMFYTAGHAVDICPPPYAVYYYDVIYLADKIGSVATDTKIFGSSGDRSTVVINSSTAALPSSNKVSSTASGTYTLASAPVVGTEVRVYFTVKG